MSDAGVVLFGIGLVGAAVTMVIHVVGVVLSWWPTTGVTWVIPLAFLALMQLGGVIGDDRQ